MSLPDTKNQHQKNTGLKSVHITFSYTEDCFLNPYEIFIQ